MTLKHIANTLPPRLYAPRLCVRTRLSLAMALVVLPVIAGTMVHTSAQTPAPAPRYTVPAGGFNTAPQLQLPTLPTPVAITPHGTVVEDVIARINDQIITRSEYERSEKQILDEAIQAKASPADLQDHLHDLLRDMIDQQLLLSKGKELGINGDAETIRQLDDIRKQNHLDSMEALEKAATQQGISFEDFKQGIKNRAITQQVVRDEVGRRLQLTNAQKQAYYAAHASDFTTPETVHLSEILVPTPENATDTQLSDAQIKADALAAKLKAGANFAELAKSSSGGPTASAGGDLGDFKRGTLGKVLEDASFSLPVGGNTAPIRTRQGFVILHVDSHQAAGVPPLSAVEPQVEEAIYIDALQPALRAYLTKARQEAYISIANGFTDTGSVRKDSRGSDFSYTAYAPPAVKKKVQNKQRMETVKAAKAQAELAAARERVAEKQTAKAEAAVEQSAGKSGKKSASAPVKQKKIRKEKIRYGQAPRNSLPVGVAQTADSSAPGNAPIGGVAPGVAMAPTESVTSITTGVGVDADDTDPLAPVAAPEHKTRFSQTETKAEVDRAKIKLAKAETKATIRPVTATQTETANEKVQAAPLGLNGDTVKKKKVKKKKGDPKERIQTAVKPVETQTPAPTINPALAGAPAPATPPATVPPQL